MTLTECLDHQWKRSKHVEAMGREDCSVVVSCEPGRSWTMPMQHETGGRQDDHFAGVGRPAAEIDKAGEGEKEHCLGSVKIYWKSLLDLKVARPTAR